MHPVDAGGGGVVPVDGARDGAVPVDGAGREKKSLTGEEGGAFEPPNNGDFLKRDSRDRTRVLSQKTGLRFPARIAQKNFCGENFDAKLKNELVP